MKVSFVLPRRGRAGSINSAVCLGNALIGRGYDVRILYRRESISLRSICRNVYYSLRYRKGNDWLPSFSGVSEGFRQLDRCTFAPGEVLVGMGSWAALEIAGLPVECGPGLHSIHGALPDVDVYLNRALRLPLPKIVVASHLVDMVREVGGQEVLGVVPNGVDRSAYFPPENESARLGVGSIYQPEPWKDPTTLRSVLERLATDMPAVHQHLFGTGRRPRGLAGATYIRMPSLEEARSIYGRCKVWMLASASEGFPHAVLEAMACGCALVSTDCGGTRDIIRDGENGFLVRVGDADALVRATKELLLNDRLREHVCMEAAKTVRHFTWKRAAEHLEACLQKVMKPDDSQS